jgi:hypothetical protein
MVESSVFGAAVGILLGLVHFKVQLKVVILYPATLLVVSGVILYGALDGQNLLTITLNSLCAVASLQIGYVLFSVAGEYLPSRVGEGKAELFLAVRAAIGRELETYFQLPGDLPPEMAAMLTKLKHEKPSYLVHSLG